MLFIYKTDKMIYYNYIPIDFTVSVSMLFYYMACAKDFKDKKVAEDIIKQKLMTNMQENMLAGM